MAVAHTATRRRSAPAVRVRWDRLARAAMLFVLLVLVYLYASPIRGLISAFAQSSARHAEVAALRAQNKRLRAEQADLQDPRTLSQRARELGLVLPGERAFIVSGLPSN